MRVCKNCGEVNDSQTQFCINCGHSEFLERNDAVCPNCKEGVSLEAIFCPNCGHKLLNVETIKDTNEVVPVNQDDWKKSAVSVKDALSQFYDNNQQMVLDTRETFNCPNCFKEIPVATAYCPSCGTPVSSVVEHKVVKRKVCIHCGTPNPLTVPYCSYCFASLADCQTQDFQLTFEEHFFDDGVVRRAVYQSEESKKLVVCANCGTLNDTQQDFCIKCGLKLVVEDQKHYCPVCGADNPYDASFCSTCNYSFEGVAPSRVEGRWKCDCGAINSKDAKYCERCGNKAPQTNKKRGKK
ncbi:MAG: zinc ribbon domain-containing protein [Clostridia bacterium]|nr:zinc ribbon domain-containing protein [Clostridia bacterium]